ncbi:hypothetical protein F4677DRAFT_451281 [Hypoxylon crocopeplum]|nr:hypothetical protein F4677DRAFT_451281 [Hypoxylon crocopeplum]
MGQQFAGPYKVNESIAQLAYKLDFPSHYQVHDVISVDQLEPAAPPIEHFSRIPPDAGEMRLEAYERRIVHINDTRQHSKFLVEYIEKPLIYSILKIWIWRINECERY